MKRSELKQLIRTVIEESNSGSNYKFVNLVFFLADDTTGILKEVKDIVTEFMTEEYDLDIAREHSARSVLDLVYRLNENTDAFSIEGEIQSFLSDIYIEDRVTAYSVYLS